MFLTRAGFNRTNLGLKHVHRTVNRLIDISFNRTNLGLKLDAVAQLAQWLASFNRTNLGLKLHFFPVPSIS